MKISRGSLIVILIALLVLAVGIVQVIARNTGNAKHADTCCPEMGAGEPAIDAGKTPAEDAGHGMTHPEGDAAVVCPGMKDQSEGKGETDSLPHGKCPYVGEGK